MARNYLAPTLALLALAAGAASGARVLKHVFVQDSHLLQLSDKNYIIVNPHVDPALKWKIVQVRPDDLTIWTAFERTNQNRTQSKDTDNHDVQLAMARSWFDPRPADDPLPAFSVLYNLDTGAMKQQSSANARPQIIKLAERGLNAFRLDDDTFGVLGTLDTTLQPAQGGLLVSKLALISFSARDRRITLVPRWRASLELERLVASYQMRVMRAQISRHALDFVDTYRVRLREASQKALAINQRSSYWQDMSQLLGQLADSVDKVAGLAGSGYD